MIGDLAIYCIAWWMEAVLRAGRVRTTETTCNSTLDPFEGREAVCDAVKSSQMVALCGIPVLGSSARIWQEAATPAHQKAKLRPMVSGNWSFVATNVKRRLLGLSFSNSTATGTPSTSAERVTRSAARQPSKLHFFDEDSHNLVEAACRHQSEELEQ